MIFQLFFPPKCALCRKVLSKEETDLCHHCREHAPEFTHAKNNLPFVAKWTAVWYYKDNVRGSLLRYKFYDYRSYANLYGKLLAMKVLEDGLIYDCVSWVPVSKKRLRKRGFDQVELIARVAAEALGLPLETTLHKLRDTPAQSSLRNIAQRKANVLGAYKSIAPETVSGKHILLLDDVITTGATASECARVLLTAGAKDVSCAAVAAASYHKK